MANANPVPALAASPDEVEILMAGNIADDDLMWVVRLSVPELHRMIQSPTSWVTSLADLPNWRYYGSSGPAPAPVLTSDFALSVQETQTIDPQGWVMLQGISGTNALTIVASAPTAVLSALQVDSVAPAIAAKLDLTVDQARSATVAQIEALTDPLQPFWDDVSADPNNPPSRKKELPVNVVPATSHFFAHFEILDKTETPPQRAARVATFLLGMSLDPQGYAAMLDGLDQRPLYLNGSEAGAGGRVAFKAPSGQAVTYANIQASGSSTGPLAEADEGGSGGTGTGGAGTGDPGDSETTCALLQGQYTPTDPDDPDQGGTGTPEGGTVKRYTGT